jgi:hypothetical protein
MWRTYWGQAVVNEVNSSYSMGSWYALRKLLLALLLNVPVGDGQVLCKLLPLPGIQCIAEAFTEEVVAKDRNEDRESRKGRKPPRDLNIILA